MGNIATNQFKSGLKFLHNDQPHTIVSNEFVKPGKGQGFSRVKVKNLLTGRTNELIFKSGDTVPSADVVEQEMVFLYTDDQYAFFMSNETYEQLDVAKTVVESEVQWLKSDAVCTVTLWNGQAIAVAPPNFVILEVDTAEPNLKGDTVTGGSKTVVLETGAQLRVPLFINEGDMLKIDTRTGAYVGREQN